MTDADARLPSTSSKRPRAEASSRHTRGSARAVGPWTTVRLARARSRRRTTTSTEARDRGNKRPRSSDGVARTTREEDEVEEGGGVDDDEWTPRDAGGETPDDGFRFSARRRDDETYDQWDVEMKKMFRLFNVDAREEEGGCVSEKTARALDAFRPPRLSSRDVGAAAENWKASMRVVVVAVTEAYEECERVRRAGMDPGCTTRDARELEESLIRCWLRLVKTPRGGASTSGRRSGESDMVQRLDLHVRSVKNELERDGTENRDDEEKTRITAALSAFSAALAGFKYCASALYETVFTPLKSFSAACLTESNFDSSAHFVAWTIRTVEIASDLTSWKEGHYARMNVYGHADFVTWTRKLLDFFYLQLSSVRGGGIIDALGYYPGWKEREDNVHRRHEQSELYRLILKLPTMRWTLPWKKYEPQVFSKVDLRFSEKFQRKLTRFVLSILDCAIVNGIVFENKESITRGDDVTDEVKALIDAIKCNKSSTVKELARSILIELGVAERLAIWAGDAASEGKIESLRDKLSSLALILTVNPCKLGDLSELIEPLMKIFTLCRTRKDRSKDNYELESKLCAILACLGVNSNEREDDMPPDCELALLRFGSGAFDVQIAVEDQYEDVASVIFDMLDGVEGDDTSKKSRADVLVPALAALAVFVRRNKELTRWFSRDGETEKILLDILRRKEPAVSRIAAACVLAFEAHHELVQALYKPSVKTDKKRERITEVHGWDSKVICQSLTAIAELIKDPAASRYGYDAAVLEVICAERRTTILHNKFHLSLQRALACVSGLKPEVIAGDKIHHVILDYLHRLLASPETSIFEIKEGLTPEETTKMHCEAVWNELELDELHQDGPRALTEREIVHFAEFIRETTEATKKLKEELKHDVEISDVCSILMEGDTDCPASQVGIVVPILTLLHKCRIFQEHNLVSEVDVAGVSDIERDACYVIGLLATKPSNQNRIANSFEIDSKNGIEQLIPLLKRYHPDDHGQTAEANASMVRRAADTITNLAHENSTIKTMVRDAGGIPPLVKLLDSHDRKVQKAAASALRTLAFKNGENKNQIVECGALPKLIFMARSEDTLLHKEAIGVIGNLVHSSSHIKRRVLDEGALQPVIELLKSSCTETQREAALLIGQFAARLEPQGRDVPDYKTKIMQRGAVESLIKMLSGTTYYREPGLREMAAFALGRLAQDSDNQVGICHSGGLQPLFNMLESDVEEITEGLRKGISSGKSDADIDADAKRLVENLQHNAAFAIYGLAESHDNVAKMLKENAFMQLQYSELMVETSKQCVNKTIKRLEEKVQRRDVFNYLAYTIASGRPIERQRIALALAWLCRNKGDIQTIFIEKRGLKILFDALIGKGAESVDYSATTSGLAGGRRKVNIALEALRNIKQNLSPSPNKEALMPQPSTPTAEDHMPVNFDHPELSDVTFVIHSKDGPHEFGAHRIAFTHVSDVFLSTLEDGKVLDDGSLRVDISNVDWNVFEAMMDFIYTGTVGVMSSLRVSSFLRDNLEDILTVTTRFDLPNMKSLVEKHFIDYVEMNELSFKRACELYRVAVEHNAVAVQDFLLCHALDNYDKRWHGDCEANPSLSAHKTRVRKIIDCFGQGIVSYIEKTLRDRAPPARDAA